MKKNKFNNLKRLTPPSTIELNSCDLWTETGIVQLLIDSINKNSPTLYFTLNIVRTDGTARLTWHVSGDRVQRSVRDLSD